MAQPFTSVVFVIEDETYRITRREGRIIGIEQWTHSSPVCDGVDIAYGYTAVKFEEFR